MRVFAESDLRQIVFVRIAYDEGYAGESCDFLRSALGVASGDDDFASGIFALDAAEGGAGFLLGGGGHGAGIQNNDFRGGGAAGAVEAAVAELLFDGGAVGLGSAAAEIFDVKAGHRTILA